MSSMRFIRLDQHPPNYVFEVKLHVILRSKFCRSIPHECTAILTFGSAAPMFCSSSHLRLLLESYSPRSSRFESVICWQVSRLRSALRSSQFVLLVCASPDR